MDTIAGLTAVDGATVVTDDYALLAFGAKIITPRRPPARRAGDGHRADRRAVRRDPTRGSLGGTRHLSAAQFVQDQRDAIALVASQDGRFTVFAWSSCDELGARASRGDAAALVFSSHKS